MKEIADVVLLAFFSVVLFLFRFWYILPCIGGGVMLTVGIVKRVRNNDNFKNRNMGLVLIIIGVIMVLPCGIVCGVKGVKAAGEAVHNYNSVYYQLHQGSVEGLERVLKNGANVEDAGLPEPRPARDGERTLLGTVAGYSTVIRDGTEKVALLIEYGADVNRVMCDYCEYGHPRGDRDRRDLCSATPVLFAADTPNYEALRLLIDNGGDVNATDYDGRTALDIVDENIDDDERFGLSNREIFRQMRELLIQNGAKNGDKGVRA